MVSSPPRAEQVLGAIRAELPELPALPAASGQPKQTARVLTRLAGTPRRLLTEDDRADLHALCRRIAVAKDILAEYDENWKAKPGAAPLEAPFWPALIAMLLAHAESTGGDDEQWRGLGLKCLNAGLGTLDMAEASLGQSAAHLSELRGWAQEIVADIRCEAPA